MKIEESLSATTEEVGSPSLFVYLGLSDPVSKVTHSIFSIIQQPAFGHYSCC
ncbi:hypothetical protein RchiOBHm_Chr7g0215991 [Rosa chinensis]|uniref:Uncharacterized protein n=1 Tax=Rosa chinensis TaxID=74649 RepID=A0A2P6PBM6_ROSCH|nr:hypothetical protein RchiOBHm_Chr7g0215991 [Rosa chinensis]